MGANNSKSSAYLESNNVVINETEMNLLNKSVNKVAVDTSVENAKSCGASIAQSQKISAGNLVIGEGASATVSQAQEAQLDFSCLQKDDVQMDVINKMSEQISNQLNDKANTEILNSLKSAIEAKSQSDFQIFPFPSFNNANSEVTQKVNNHMRNTTKVNVQNVIENSTYASFHNSNIQECIGKIVQSQEQQFGNIITGAGSTLLLTQEQRATLLMECVQQANIGQRVITDIVKFAGMDLKIQRDTKTETEMDAEAKATAKQAGLFGIMEGSGLLGLFGLGMPALSPSSSSSSLLCCICCCCLILLLVLGGGAAAFGFGGDSGATPAPDQYGGFLSLASTSYK